MVDEGRANFGRLWLRLPQGWSPRLRPPYFHGPPWDEPLATPLKSGSHCHLERPRAKGPKVVFGFGQHAVPGRQGSNSRGRTGNLSPPARFGRGFGKMVQWFKAREATWVIDDPELLPQPTTVVQVKASTGLRDCP